MKQIKKLFSICMVFTTILIGCTDSTKQNLNNTDSVKSETSTLNTVSYSQTELDASNAFVLADSISYDVTIKNPDPNDTWTEEDIGRMDELALANIILDAIYNKRLTAYSYADEQPMTIEQVKELENKYSRDKVARMRFIEEWYFDKKEMKFVKKVNAIMLGYEKFNSSGEVRYAPGVKVYLNDKSKNPPQENTN